MGLILNFHGIGDATRTYEPGEEPYWLSQERFTHLLDMADASVQPVGFTFDDGNSSDFEIAAPELRRRGAKAIFFVLAGKLDQPGYLTRAQVKELDDDPLFTIGSHGMMHRAWPECGEAELDHEIGEAHRILSGICGRMVEDVGLPFGRYDRRVMRQLAKYGHKAVYSSDGQERLSASNPIPRFSPRKDTPLKMLDSMIGQRAGLTTRIRNELRGLVKAST